MREGARPARARDRAGALCSRARYNIELCVTGPTSPQHATSPPTRIPRARRGFSTEDTVMKIAQEIRAGNVIMHSSQPWVVLKTEYSRGGRNAATVRMKL